MKRMASFTAHIEFQSFSSSVRYCIVNLVVTSWPKNKINPSETELVCSYPILFISIFYSIQISNNVKDKTNQLILELWFTTTAVSVQDMSQTLRWSISYEKCDVSVTSPTINRTNHLLLVYERLSYLYLLHVEPLSFICCGE